jgi:hypothetical protein
MDKALPEKGSDSWTRSEMVPETTGFDAPLAVPGQIASHHFGQIYEFDT